MTFPPIIIPWRREYVEASLLCVRAQVRRPDAVVNIVELGGTYEELLRIRDKLRHAETMDGRYLPTHFSYHEAVLLGSALAQVFEAAHDEDGPERMVWAIGMIGEKVLPWWHGVVTDTRALAMGPGSYAWLTEVGDGEDDNAP